MSEPTMGKSSLQPGVNGESCNAPYGPKAFETQPIESMKNWGDMHNHAENGWAVGRTSGPIQSGMGDSSLKP